MKILFLAVSISFLYLSCDHPEEKKIERNQGRRNEFNSGDNRDEDIGTIESTISAERTSERGTVLQMEIEHGVRYVWIEINGIRLRFIFDTGASSICISPSEASVLYRQGTLKKEDILDVEYFQDATGRISEGTKINLREVKIGDMIFENVKATVVDNINAPLLLGQSVLERFGKIEIDNRSNEIIFR